MKNNNKNCDENDDDVTYDINYYNNEEMYRSQLFQKQLNDYLSSPEFREAKREHHISIIGLIIMLFMLVLLLLGGI